MNDLPKNFYKTRFATILGPKGQVGPPFFPGENQGGWGEGREEKEAKEVGGKFNLGQPSQKVLTS